LHPALQRRVLVQQLIESGVEPGFDLVEWLRARPGTPKTIGAGRSVRRDAEGRVQIGGIGGAARFDAARRSARLEGRTGRIPFGGLTVAWQILVRRGRDGVVPRPQRESYDADSVGAAIMLRYWQPGDRFHPIGQEAAAKLQDLFVNAKVARDERHRRVVAVTASGEVFWVEGLRMAEHFKITPRTRRWLEWGWSR
jgi:tRNA(Ile)-lysidine synthetase-like protein